MKIFYIAFFLLFSSISYSQSPCPGLDSLNYGDQWYHTVQIGSQCWLKENLNVGNVILAVKNQINNDTIEKFCYNNDPGMCDIYGGLYQWREAMQYTTKQGARGICPIGWHIPFQSEFDTLISIVGSNGNALLKVGQAGGTNTSGFTGLLVGYNAYSAFGNLGINANFWNCYSGKPSNDPYMGFYLELWNDNTVISGRHYFAEFGLSVRCIKDNSDILLQSPYGGENWQSGTTHKISWGGDLSGKKIKIEYSIDNGINWQHVIDSIPAIDGNYNWTIPNTPSKNCKARITDLNNSNSYSISDNVFLIYTSCPTIEHGGKLYNTLMIGNKCWLGENLDNGIMIPGNKEQLRDSVIEKYCYNDDTANCTKYGGLYTFSEMNEENFCPTFWHIPSYNEFDNLFSSEIWDANALKSEGQGTGFGTGTNTSGFSAMLSGYRDYDGTFKHQRDTVWFPYSYFIYPTRIDAIYFRATSGSITFYDNFVWSQAGSARCVMDDVGPLMLKSPAGGENFIIGTIQKIKWTLSEVINIRIDYSTNNGTTWINIIQSYQTSEGSYHWTIPNTPSTNCRVKITSTNSSDTNSISNIFSIYQVPTNPCPGVPTVNYAGQTYNTITIGEQCWLRENLNIGMMINVTQNQSDNGIIEKYCYNNDTNNCSIYGGLYQWNEAMLYTTKEGANGICPAGWHIPTWSDLSILKLSVGNNSNELKELGQGSGSGAGTNSSGFTALLAGISYNGIFYYLNNYADFWTSSKYDISSAYNLQLVNTTNYIQGLPVDEMAGFSIRCINDSSVSALPVELTSFTASVINNNVKLNWTTATEINFSSFEIQKKSINNNNWQKVALVNASGNSNSPKQYSYIEKNVNSGQYNYRLKMIDLDGSFKYSKIVSAEIVLPVKFELSNAYPNPWNPTTTIRYQLPINSPVSIKVFDVLGKEVTTLVNETKRAGMYEVSINSQNLSSGIYYYQMRAGNFIETKKFTLIK